jgi:hypothetical protein
LSAKWMRASTGDTTCRTGRDAAAVREQMRDDPCHAKEAVTHGKLCSAGRCREPCVQGKTNANTDERGAQ